MNQRVVDHIAPHPERAPYLPWLNAALERPLEVWRRYRHGVLGIEPRLYYLFAAAQPELHGVVAIVGESDLVVFNMIPIMLYFGYDTPFGRCPHGCCDDRELV